MAYDVIILCLYYDIFSLLIIKEIARNDTLGLTWIKFQYLVNDAIYSLADDTKGPIRAILLGDRDIE